MGSVSWVDLELYDLNNPICVCVCVHGTLDAALLTIFPEAGLQNNCIRTSYYIDMFCAVCYTGGTCRTAMITNGCHVMN